MKLFNLTKLPDSIIKPILAGADRRIGARGKNCIVRITAKRGHGLGNGHAKNHYGTAWWKLGKRNRKGYCKGDGYIELCLRTDKGGAWSEDQALEIATWVWELALHEFAHIRDFKFNDLDGPKGGNYRRGRINKMAWKQRPLEIRAENATHKALQNTIPPQVQEAILEYAIWLTRESKGESL